MTEDQDRIMEAICKLPPTRGELSDAAKLEADIQELTARYKSVVRDMLIVATCPDTPERILGLVNDEISFTTQSLLDRLDTRNLHTIERLLPTLLAFDDLNLLAPERCN